MSGREFDAAVAEAVAFTLYCEHGYYIGSGDSYDSTICAELRADDEWNDENPPLVGHLVDERDDPAPLSPTGFAPSRSSVVDQRDAPVVLTTTIPKMHYRDGGLVVRTQPESQLFRCAACNLGFRKITVI